jgi:hypothetical protein
MGIFQLAVRDVVEANGGMAEISARELTEKVFIEVFLLKEKPDF